MSWMGAQILILGMKERTWLNSQHHPLQGEEWNPGLVSSVNQLPFRKQPGPILQTALP